MKLLKTNICLTSRASLLFLSFLLLSTLVIASVYKNNPVIKEMVQPKSQPWEPSAEDIAFQDSMYAIIERTQLDLDTIRSGIDKILYKLERLEYPDGTYDSIRYVIGGKIDKLRNK